MRILVAEDEHRIAEAVRQGLVQENFAVDIAYTGTDAYDLASTEDYDTIILDLMLPGMDGLSICRRLREEQIQTPILILTAKSQIEDRVAGLNTGADDYLSKPFAFEELLARVRALERRPPQTQANVLRVADLTLDTVAYTTSRHGRPIQLTGKEFALLEYLARHAGTTLSKEQIIQHVWDYEAEILPNTVEVYMRKLRQKIDLPFPHSPPLLTTLRGFGYRLGEN